MLKIKSGVIDSDEIIRAIMQTTPLKQIGKGIVVKWEDPVVPRYNGQRAQTIMCSPVPGIETEKARLAIADKIESLHLPEGYSLQWKGERDASTQTMYYLFMNVPLGVVLMIAILIMLFKDYKKPLIIILLRAFTCYWNCWGNASYKSAFYILCYCWCFGAGWYDDKKLYCSYG